MKISADLSNPSGARKRGNESPRGLLVRVHSGYLSRREDARFDRVIYPPIEGAPKKFAITYRNRWIAREADLLIAYVSHTCGGAYATLRAACAKGKTIFNLAKE